MNMQIVVSFLDKMSLINVLVTEFKKRERKKRSALSKVTFFIYVKILLKLQLSCIWIMTFKSPFGECWNQLNNKYILIYKRNQSAVIFDWLYLDRVLFNLWIYYTLFYYYKNSMWIRNERSHSKWGKNFSSLLKSWLRQATICSWFRWVKSIQHQTI